MTYRHSQGIFLQFSLPLALFFRQTSPECTPRYCHALNASLKVTYHVFL